MAVIKRALISVSDKQGILEFAKNLQSFGVEILSTGGTAKLFRENNIPVIEVSDYKTLNIKVIEFNEITVYTNNIFSWKTVIKHISFL